MNITQHFFSWMLAAQQFKTSKINKLRFFNKKKADLMKNARPLQKLKLDDILEPNSQQTTTIEI